MRAEGAVMHALLRATALTAAVAGVLSCATPPHASASAQNEYKWLILHGCDCGGIAYASGSAAPSWLGGQTLAGYVYERPCVASRGNSWWSPSAMAIATSLAI